MISGSETSFMLYPFCFRISMTLSTSFFDSSEIPSSMSSLTIPIVAFLSNGKSICSSFIDVESKLSWPEIAE